MEIQLADNIKKPRKAHAPTRAQLAEAPGITAGDIILRFIRDDGKALAEIWEEICNETE